VASFEAVSQPSVAVEKQAAGISPGRSNRSRPSIECHFSDGEKFVDRSAVARLNGHAFHDRIDEFA
jgi:hypothetical protein